MNHKKCGVRSERGFSLIITVTLMVLLSLIAIGILSLSTTTLRSANNDRFQQEARSNARLGLQLALAQLQETMGSDRAVTAPADAVVADAAQPHLVGVWESWSWDPTTDSSTPDYPEEKESRFQGWLTSEAPSSNQLLDLSYAATSPSGNVAQLFGDGTFGTDSGEEAIFSEMVPLLSEDEETSGNYAWTVLSEGTKARVDLTRDESRPDDGEHLTASLTFPERYDQTALGIEGFEPTSEEEWGRIVSSRTLDAAVGSGGENSSAKNHFFDYTVHSRGVLSDAVNGGLKRDLTVILEEEILNGTRVYSEESTPFGVADPHWSYLADYYNQYLNFQGSEATEAVDVTDNIVEADLDENDSSPEGVVLRPVIAKLQIIFSMVSHLHTWKDTTSSSGDYATEDSSVVEPHLRPWLVFEPVVTLWNPYSVPIEFDSFSIGLDKIPVAFRFGKEDDAKGRNDLRITDSGSSVNTRNYWPLSTFVHGGAKQNAITNFAFNVRGGSVTEGIRDEPILLEPGENKVFSVFVEEGDSWGDVRENFFIQGTGGVGASNANSTVKGLDLVEGFNSVGGLRVDHLARNNANRNRGSLYDFELSSPFEQRDYHVCVLRPEDSIIVEAKVSNNDATSDSADDSTSDFTMLVEMDALGEIDDDQILGSSFTIREKEDIYEEDVDPIIERSFNISDLKQLEGDTDEGGKTPFAVFTMSAKSASNLLNPTKGWLFGNPVLASYAQDEDEAPHPVQSYEFSFREVNSINSFPMVEIDPQTNRSYFGSGQSASNGLTASPMFVLPTNPMVSLGQFQAANLISAVKPPFFNYPFGNSFAHPLLPADQAVSGDFVDHSYLLNQRLWDSFYFSGLSKEGGASNEDALRDFFDGESTLIPRLQPFLSEGRSADDVIAELTDDSEFASREMAANQMLSGPFNIHSTSVSAWKALLMSAFEVNVPTRDASEHEVTESSAFARLLPSYSESLGDLAQAAGSGNVSVDAQERAERWLGFHEFNEEQMELLAEEIVEQIQKRCQEDGGPFLSLGEFVNRRIGSENESFSSRGVLQTAIDEANDPDDTAGDGGQGEQGVLFSLEDGVGIVDTEFEVANPSALEGNTAEGTPATLIQGDLLQHLGALITVRSDTMRIRSYGNSVAKNGEVRSEAWCEAIVQRVPEFVDNNQTPGTDFDDLNAVNQTFGRRFQVVSFRWLSREEV